MVYGTGCIERQAIEKVFGVERAQFFKLMEKKYSKEKEEFSIEYAKHYSNRKLRKEME